MSHFGTRARLAATAIAFAAIVGTGAAAVAQDYQGSTVTIGGGSSGGKGVVIAPGVTIDGGDVVNETGIGVISGGGSSIGASTGGDTNASTVE
jgi:hypothetical protein